MSSSKQGTVTVKFSIGFGNNLFQYCFARLLAEFHELQFNHPTLSGFNIPRQNHFVNNKLPTIKIRNEGYQTGIYQKYFEGKNSKVNYDVRGYFEDYTIYRDRLEKIRSWFPTVKRENRGDLIIHIRLQNRLVQLNHYLNFISGKAYKNAISNFKFNKLHIITDAEKWDYYDKEDIKKIHADIMAGPNPGAEWISIEESIQYMHELVDAFKEYDPVIHCTNAPTIKGSGGLRDKFMDAFDLIRSFNQVILYNSTFSWWAAVLGKAEKVGVFSLWKPGRGNKNPNLGQTNYPGWLSWGDEKDLIRNRSDFPSKYKTPFQNRMRKTIWKNRYYRMKKIIFGR